MAEIKVDDEVAKELGREMFSQKQLTLKTAAEMMTKYRKKNLIATEAPSLYSRIRLMVGSKGPIPKSQRDKISAIFLKLDELEGNQQCP